MTITSLGTRLGRFGVAWDDFFFWIKSDWLHSTIASKRSLNELGVVIDGFGVGEYVIVEKFGR